MKYDDTVARRCVWGFAAGAWILTAVAGFATFTGDPGGPAGLVGCGPIAAGSTVFAVYLSRNRVS